MLRRLLYLALPTLGALTACTSGGGSGRTVDIVGGEDTAAAWVDTLPVIDSVSAMDAADTAEASDTQAPPSAPALFSAAAVPRIALTARAEALEALIPQADVSPTPITARIALDGVDQNATVMLTLVGEGEDTRGLDTKPDLDLVVSEAGIGSLFREVVGLSLDAMAADPAQAREQLAHFLYTAWGVANPRATYARVSINGLDLGLYSVVEHPGAERFAGKAWGSAPWVVSPKGRNDLWPWQVEHFEVLRGDPVHVAAGLHALATRINAAEQAIAAAEGGEGGPADLFALLADVFDMNGFVRLVAAEAVAGRSWSYPFQARSYVLVRPPVGRWHMVPTGLGSAFSGRPNPWRAGTRLMGLCRRSLACRRRLRDAIVTLLDGRVETLQAAHAFAATAELWSAEDPRRIVAYEEIAAGQGGLLDAVEVQAAWLEAGLDCVDPADVDRDHDGASGCEGDCNDDDPHVFPGAPERCNLIDDDCDGVIDNDANQSCPGCLEVDVVLGDDVAPTRWSFCYRERLAWPDAEAACVDKGGHLVSVPDAQAAGMLRDRALTLQWANWWLGLHDQDEEGTFVWSDGRAVDYTGWGDGEPNDAGGDEDCAHLAPWSRAWNDVPCAAHYNYVCAVPDHVALSDQPD